MNALEDCASQIGAVDGFFREHGERHERLRYAGSVRH
jgi:hypothetical protein